MSSFYELVRESYILINSLYGQEILRTDFSQVFHVLSYSGKPEPSHPEYWKYSAVSLKSV